MSKEESIRLLNILIVTEAGHNESRNDQVNLLMDEFHSVEKLIEVFITTFANFALQFTAILSSLEKRDVTHVEVLQHFRDGIADGV